MDGSAGAAAKPETKPGAEPRGMARSTIAFPYVSLDDAITVAQALHDLGGVPCDRDQLASKMGQEPGSGNFGLKLSGARLFGLIETNAQGKNQLTPLGFEIIDPSRERAAKAEAFLRVPLYRRLYDDFKNKMLPSRFLGLENAFVALGVAPKSKEQARRMFDKSARSAGYFPNEKEDRLVAPVIVGTSPPSDRALDGTVGGKNTIAQMSEPSPPPERSKAAQHPFIVGLLEKLPDPDKQWPIADQIRWLQTAAHIFGLMYESQGEIEVRATPQQGELALKR